MINWQPIETAPADQLALLGCSEKRANGWSAAWAEFKETLPHQQGQFDQRGIRCPGRVITIKPASYADLELQPMEGTR